MGVVERLRRRTGCLTPRSISIPYAVNDPDEQAAANQIDERHHREISSDPANIHSQAEEFRKRQEKACWQRCALPPSPRRRDRKDNRHHFFNYRMPREAEPDCQTHHRAPQNTADECFNEMQRRHGERDVASKAGKLVIGGFQEH